MQLFCFAIELIPKRKQKDICFNYMYWYNSCVKYLKFVIAPVYSYKNTFAGVITIYIRYAKAKFRGFE